MIFSELRKDIDSKYLPYYLLNTESVMPAIESMPIIDFDEYLTRSFDDKNSSF